MHGNRSRTRIVFFNSLILRAGFVAGAFALAMVSSIFRVWHRTAVFLCALPTHAVKVHSAQVEHAKTTAMYSHSNGPKERVQIVKKLSEDQGGGYAIFIPSLKRERLTTAEKLDFNVPTRLDEIFLAHPDLNQQELMMLNTIYDQYPQFDSSLEYVLYQAVNHSCPMMVKTILDHYPKVDVNWVFVSENITLSILFCAIEREDAAVVAMLVRHPGIDLAMECLPKHLGVADPLTSWDFVRRFHPGKGMEELLLAHPESLIQKYETGDCLKSDMKKYLNSKIRKQAAYKARHSCKHDAIRFAAYNRDWCRINREYFERHAHDSFVSKHGKKEKKDDEFEQKVKEFEMVVKEYLIDHGIHSHDDKVSYLYGKLQRLSTYQAKGSSKFDPVKFFAYERLLKKVEIAETSKDQFADTIQQKMANVDQYMENHGKKTLESKMSYLSSRVQRHAVYQVQGNSKFDPTMFVVYLKMLETIEKLYLDSQNGKTRFPESSTIS